MKWIVFREDIRDHHGFPQARQRTTYLVINHNMIDIRFMGHDGRYYSVSTIDKRILTTY